MPTRLLLMATLLTCVPVLLPAEEPGPAPRVVFLGDSITQAGAGAGGYLTMLQEALKADASSQPCEIIGAGISGNRVPDLERRLERDVLSKQPQWVVIYIGINDVWHSLQGRGTPKEEYEQGLRRIIDQIKAADAKVILCTPSVIGEKTDGTNPLDAMLDEYAELSRRVARDTGSKLVDLRQAFLTHLREHNSEQQAKGILTTDGVHLNEAGNRFVAAQMQSALQKTAAAERLLRHVVLFKFKETVSEAEVAEVVRAFSDLQHKIDTIVHFEYGTDVSVENKSEGFTHCFQVTFRSTKDRDAYLPHPAHGEFVKLVGPRLEKVLVFDYWTGQ